MMVLGDGSGIISDQADTPGDRGQGVTDSFIKTRPVRREGRNTRQGEHKIVDNP